MCARIDEHFCGKGVVLRFPAEPCAAMHEYEYWCIWTRRAVDVEFLRHGRTISFTPRRSKPRARQLAVAHQPTDSLGLQGRVENLIIGRIELDLIHVHPYAWTFTVRRRPDWAHRRRLSKRRRCRNGRGGAKNRPPCNRLDGGVELEIHHSPRVDVVP